MNIEHPLYIIPARGGSKGIPRKNIKELAGKPLIGWTINAAFEAFRKTGGKGNILLSTEDGEIANVAKSLGLEVKYMRPIELATDTAGSREVILHLMDWADSEGIKYDAVVLLQPTSPLRTGQDIIEAMELYKDGVDMVVSVCESTDNPYYNLFELSGEGRLKICMGDGKIIRRQDAPKVWAYNGAIYVIRPESIRRMGLGEFPARIPYIMPRDRSVDIDTLADWQLAESRIQNMK